MNIIPTDKTPFGEFMTACHLNTNISINFEVSYHLIIMALDLNQNIFRKNFIPHLEICNLYTTPSLNVMFKK